MLKIPPLITLTTNDFAVSWLRSFSVKPCAAHMEAPDVRPYWLSVLLTFSGVLSLRSGLHPLFYFIWLSLSHALSRSRLLFKEGQLPDDFSIIHSFEMLQFIIKSYELPEHDQVFVAVVGCWLFMFSVLEFSFYSSIVSAVQGVNQSPRAIWPVLRAFTGDVFFP